METPQVEEVIFKGSFCLILCLLSYKNFNKEELKHTMRRILRLGKIIYFRDLRSDLLLTEFEDRKDKEKVMREGLWSFD